MCLLKVKPTDLFPMLMEMRLKLSGVLFKVLFKEYSNISMDKVFSNLLTNDTIRTAFPNLITLASLAVILPVTTATVERSFSDTKFIKTRLRNRLGEDNLGQTMCICIEGPDTLNDDELKDINSSKRTKTSQNDYLMLG